MRIYYKLIIMLLASSIIPVLFISRIIFYNAEHSLGAEILSKLNNVASDGADKLEAFLSERKANMMVLQKRDIFTIPFSILEKFCNDPSNPSYLAAEKDIDAQMAVLKTAYKYVNIMLADKDGKIIYVSNPKRGYELNQLIPDKDTVFQKAQEGIYIGEIQNVSDKEHPLVLFLAGFVYDAAGEIIGLVHSELDMEEIFNRLYQNTDLGESGEIVWAKKAPGGDVLFLSPLKYELKIAHGKTLTLSNKNILPAQMVAIGESGSGRSLDYRGKKVLSAWRPITSLGWELIAKIDEDEAFVPIQKLQGLLIAVLLISIVSIVLTILVIAKSISDPIDKLREGVEIIGSGNLDYKVSINTRDEIGELSKAFDAMTTHLKKTTTSIDNLVQEITERKKAEDALAKKTLELDAALKEALKSREVLSVMLEDNNQIRKTLEHRLEELRLTQNMLVQSEKLASLGKLVSEIAHEVNNPLMIISGNAQISLMSEIEDTEVKNNLQAIVDECQRAKSIIHRLLKFAKPSKGETVKANINKSIETTVAILEHQYKLDGVEIKREYYKNLPPVSIDEQQMQEVFMNLLNNARDAMPQGGVVTITTSLEGNFVKIDFTDTGSGIPEEVKQKIPEPFFTTKEKGTGLGLSVCHGIIKAHNGELRVESELDKGATFTILL
ncbi:MAG: ATP-binding protein, partial [Candidatus Omnitrophica bacterium]|nr:ATP-binding protein [Candidatus Omnitrophota bacterium]